MDRDARSPHQAVTVGEASGRTLCRPAIPAVLRAPKRMGSRGLWARTHVSKARLLACSDISTGIYWVMRTSELIRQVRTDAGLTQHELAGRAGTSQAAVARYEAGAVSPSVATLERLVRAAGASLVLGTQPAPASDISSGRAAKLRRHRMDIIDRARANGVVDVRVFGSVVRGDDDEASDIDLLVSFDASGGEGLRPIIRLKSELEELLGETVDVVPVELLSGEVAETARREAVPL